jgi:hypothetical protein
MKKMLTGCLISAMFLSGCTYLDYKESIEKGNAALEKKNYEAAEKAFSTAVRLKPEEKEAQALLNETVDALKEQESIEKYVKEMKSLSLKMSKINQSWDELRNFSSTGQIDDVFLDATVYDKVIPATTDLREQASAIKPPNDEAIEINELFISTLEKQQQAFLEIILRINTADTSKITRTDEMLNEVNRSDKEMNLKLDSLVEKYNIDTLAAH